MRRSILVACAALLLCQCASVSTPDEARLDGAMESEVAAGFSGVVLVKRDGAVLASAAYGSMRGVPFTTNSRLWIASAGKQFTAAAILRLVETGKLGLDWPLSRIFPETPPDKAAITVRQILSYTSGLAQSNAGETAQSADAALAQILALPMEAAPGERFIYSNANYILAAVVVERISGEPFPRFIQREVFDRAGLSNTGQAAGRTPNVAPVAGELPARLAAPRWSALGYYSTTGDLADWSEALLDHRALSEESVADLFAPLMQIGEGHAGLGWFVGATPRGGQRIFTRGSEDFGANALVYIYPKSRTTIIVLTHGGMKTPDLSWSRAMHGAIEEALAL